MLCGFQTRFDSLITHVVNALGYVIPQIEQELTLNSSLRAVQLDICRFKFGNLNAKLATLNVVLCGFKTRLKHSLTLVMDDIDYGIHEIDPSLTSNNPLCVVQAQDTLQIRWPVCSEIVFLHCIAVKQSSK